MSSMPGLRGHGWLRQGLHAHWPKCQVKEPKGFVLAAKASRGKFQKDGGIRLELKVLCAEHCSSKSAAWMPSDICPGGHCH